MEVSCGLAVAPCGSCGKPAGEVMLSSEGDGGKGGSAEVWAGWFGVLGLQVFFEQVNAGESYNVMSTNLVYFRSFQLFCFIHFMTVHKFNRVHAK
jgi:hypothetical protein